jgi:hypothetical protein
MFILRECVAHGADLASVLFATDKIEDSELYRRMPKKRQTALLRARRIADRLAAQK